MPNFEDLSDEEISKLTPAEIAAMSQVQASTEESSTNNGESTEEAQTTEETRESKEEAAPEEENHEATEENQEVLQESDDKANPGDGKTADEGKTEPAKQGKPVESKDPAKVTETPAIDYEAEYKKLLKPIKVNGREIQVQNADEAVQLMQMGAGYSKKMAALKPHLATLKMLENNGITDETLGFLIDVHKKVPEAINKLVKDSGIDPMDLSAEKADGYKPTNHKPAAAEMELDQVLDDIKDSPVFDKTIEVVSKVWDNGSRTIIAQNPQALKLINAHMESGIYELIATEIERERVLGRLVGLSDLEAYRQVGDAMNASGKFAHLENTAGQPKSPSQQATPAPVVVKPNPKQADDSKLNEKRRAAAPAKTGVSTAVKTDLNPLSMSDEEFAKFKPY